MKKLNNKFLIYQSITSFLFLLGIIISIYLSISHYRVFTDLGYKSFCAISKALNCDTVSQSKYSVFFGIPVAQWGVVGYSFLTLLFIYSIVKKRNYPSLFLIILFCFSLCSLFLGIISSYFIHAYCMMCLVTYLINFLLLFVFIDYFLRNKINLINQIKKDSEFFKKEKAFLGFLVVSFVIVIISLQFQTKYWEFKIDLKKENYSTGFTKEGHPWIGADNPELIIEEYTDYLCFQCRKMHFILRDLIIKNPGKIRLVHRHYPMDSRFNTILVKNKFHEGAGELALIGVYAGLSKKFWPVNDALFNLDFSKQSFSLKELSEKTGLNPAEIHTALNHDLVRKYLDHDIYSGLKLEIFGTPAYKINGKIYTGNIPGEILEKYIK